MYGQWGSLGGPVGGIMRPKLDNNKKMEEHNGTTSTP